MILKKFMLDKKNIERDSYFWNMFGSMLMAFQSVIMLMILTRTVGLVEAGIFTIANANANLFLTIGKYGMRYFQVSDVKSQFSFVDYRVTRIITSIIMVMVSGAYVAYSMVTNGYTLRKALIIFWMCLFKTVDAVEDVYHGLFQKENRLDVAAKAMSLRAFITILVFGLGVIVSKDLLLSLIISTVLTVILFIIFTILVYGEFQVEKKKLQKGNVMSLLKICFPLFVGTFLSFYIGNAPKYAIDCVLNDEIQACYGFLSMPVFVIGLLNGFIFNPMVYYMSILWNKGEVRRFVKKTLIQIGIIVAITIVCIVGAYFVGIPVLSILYNTDLSLYKSELLILLLGGGFLGISGVLNTVITIIRFQDSLVWGYVFDALLAWVFSKQIVEWYGMIGASILYTILMGVLCVIFLLLFFRGIYKNLVS